MVLWEGGLHSPSVPPRSRPDDAASRCLSVRPARHQRVWPPALIASACAIAGGPPEVAGYETAETIE